MLLGVVVVVVVVVVAVVLLRWWFTLTMRATDAMKMNETFSTKVHFYTLSLEEEEEEEASRHHLSSSPPAWPFLLYLTYCIAFFFNILIGRDKWVYYRKKQRSTKHFSFYAHTSFKV